MSDFPLEADKSAPRQRVDSVVIINTGEGKGKSSSAFGVMGRAWAQDWKIGVVQFIKAPDWPTGEQKLGAQLGVEWHTMGDGFTWDSVDMEASQAAGVAAWKQAATMLQGDYRLLILDEITYPINWGWIDEAEVTSALEGRSPSMNVILTGRDASAGLIEVAQTVTNMAKIKHAFDQGIVAMKGVEY